MKLRAGQIYMRIETGEIGLLRKGLGILLQPCWELEFPMAVMPEDLNSHFKELLRDEFVLIGHL